MINWTDITKEDVLKAIKVFQKEQPKHPPARNTFLIYEGKKLPAKHIRGMAYKIAKGTEVSKSEYTGGKETVDFFEKLGFEVLYTGKSEPPKTTLTIKKQIHLLYQKYSVKQQVK